MQEQRFKVGDLVTYKYKDRTAKGYRYGGNCQGGYRGKITSYGSYDKIDNCYNINVATRTGGSFTMLECEFEEWDNQSTPSMHDFKVGDYIYAPKGDSEYDHRSPEHIPVFKVEQITSRGYLRASYGAKHAGLKYTLARKATASEIEAFKKFGNNPPKQPLTPAEAFAPSKVTYVEEPVDMSLHRIETPKKLSL